MAEPALIAKNATTVCKLLPWMASQHRFIAGATGTGAIITLQTMAMNLPEISAPVLMADVKRDPTCISQAGKMAMKWPAP